MLRTLFAWVLHLQNMVLLAYLSWAIFDPTDAGLFSAVFFLPPLWFAAVVLGAWCWWRGRDTPTLLLAIWGGSAAPLVLAVLGGLVQSNLLPITDGTRSLAFFAFGLFAYPLYLFCTWLLSLTKPPVAPPQRSEASLVAKILGILVTLLAALALLLLGDLVFDYGWFEQGTFEPWLYVGCLISLITALVAGPFALLSMLRRSQPFGISIWILAALVTTSVCYLAIFAFIILHSAG